MQLLGIAMLGSLLIVAVAATVRQLGWAEAARLWTFTLGMTGFVVLAAALASGAFT